MTIDSLPYEQPKDIVIGARAAQASKLYKMRNLAAALALALLLFAAPARADDVAFTHVTVVDVVEGRLPLAIATVERF